MELSGLKNYGKNLHDATHSMSWRTRLRVGIGIITTIIHELGLRKTWRFLVRSNAKRREFKKVDLGELRNMIRNEKFLDEMVENAVLFATMRDIIGEQATIDVFYKIYDKVMPIVAQDIFPTVDELKATGKPMDAFKAYITRQMEEDAKQGLHEMEIIEDSQEAFQFNVTWCAWFEIKKALGVPAAALPDCYADDVFMTPGARELGFRFARKCTFARGCDHCDFRFEHL